MAITVARSTDSGAPVLTSAAGSFIGVLDWFLVGKMGWTKAALGTNIASYRAPTGNRFYMQVDDSTAINVRVTGWETLTALNTGTNQYPSNTQLSGGLWLPKSFSTITYRCYSNGPTVYIVMQQGGGYQQILGMGDCVSFRAGGDAYCSFIAGNSSGSYSAGSALLTQQTPSTALFAPRDVTQTGTSAQCNVFGNVDLTQINATIGGWGVQMPSRMDGAMHISPMYLGDYVSRDIRAWIPGLWTPLHVRTLTDGYIFTANAGLLNGRTFEVIDSTNGSQIFIELTDNWTTALP